MWKPDRSSKTPIYQQIADYMEHRIAFGEFPPGSTLPSERKLAAVLRVNRSTVVAAYEELRATGILVSSKGNGTIVSNLNEENTTNQTPNWKEYVEGGNFLPNQPFVRRIREELLHKKGLIDFASGQLSPDLYPQDIVRELLQKRPFYEQLGYDNPQGCAQLRETLVSFLAQHLRIHTTDSSILISSGSQQSLYLILQCLLNPGDAVAIEDPSYCYSLPMFQSAGLRLFRIPSDEHGINPEEVMALYRKHKIRMLFVNPNFQNPTGSVMPTERKMRLLEIASELGIPIVEDDTFSLTAFDGHPPPTLKSLDKNNNVLYIGSLSKTATSGLRIGWLIAPQSVISRLSDARQQMDFGLSSIPQWVANHFIKEGHLDNHIQFLRTELAKKRNELMRGLTEIMGDTISYAIPQGGLTLWCKINREVDEFKWLEESTKRGVIFVPGTVYGSKKGWIRLSFARPYFHQIMPGIQQLHAALEMCSN
jgi:GntR family transcriptional regulator of abcA and norABC